MGLSVITFGNSSTLLQCGPLRLRWFQDIQLLGDILVCSVSILVSFSFFLWQTVLAFVRRKQMILLFKLSLQLSVNLSSFVSPLLYKVLSVFYQKLFFFTFSKLVSSHIYFFIHKMWPNFCFLWHSHLLFILHKDLILAQIFFSESSFLLSSWFFCSFSQGLYSHFST